MTIHSFDGYHWTSSRYNPVEDQSLSVTLLPTAYHISMDTTAFLCGNGFARFSSSSALQSITMRHRKGAPAGESVLVVGTRALFERTASSGGMHAIVPKVGDVLPSGTLISQWPSLGTNINHLPIAVIDNHKFNGVYLHDTATYLTDSAYTSALASKQMAGLDFTQSNMYEVVYKFDENRIEFWINDVRVIDIAYTFSAAQKANWISVAQVLLAYGSGAVSTTECTYVANTRLGPVKTIGKEPVADANISPVFGVGPHFQKVAGSTTPSTKLTTKESGTALFEYGTDLPADSQILCVTQTSRLSTQHKSARETKTQAQLVLAPNGGYNEQAAFDVSTITDYTKNNSYSLETNPVTGMPWTVEELNNLVAGFKLEITDLYTVAE